MFLVLFDFRWQQRTNDDAQPQTQTQPVDIRNIICYSLGLNHIWSRNEHVAEEASSFYLTEDRRSAPGT